MIAINSKNLKQTEINDSSFAKVAKNIDETIFELTVWILQQEFTISLSISM